jgi:hypothetical protein
MNAYRVLGGKLEEKRLQGRHRSWRIILKLILEK